MKQKQTDIWTTIGTTPGIISLFKLSLVEGRSDAGPLTSRRCGLGWVYTIQAVNAQSSSGGTESGRCTIFNISFATPHVAVLNLNKLSVTVKAGDRTSTSVSKITVHVSDILLPVSESVLLASISAPNFTGDILVQIRVDLPGPLNFEHAFREPAPPNSKLHSAVAQLLQGEDIGNVKFGLFTRRKGHDVTNPNIIFANSSLLHGENAFLTNHNDSVVNARDLETQIFNAYDYMSDSDLESDDDPDADDFGDLDSEVLSLLGGAATRPKEAKAIRRTLDDEERVILIRDTAFATWKALVFYLYTKEIHFKPLISSRNAEASDHHITCSPKSMYRLATKIGSEELQLLSLEAIIHDISENNIIEELFSHFTSMYPEIQQAEVNALIPLLEQPAVAEKLLSEMESVVTKGMPHYGAIIATIVRRAVLGVRRGKVEPGETSQQAALRELQVRWNETIQASTEVIGQEEAGITAPLQHAGTLLFTTGIEEAAYHIEIYRADEYTGVVTETDEMRPEWFSLPLTDSKDRDAAEDAPPIPFDNMWEDDRHWLPLLISETKFAGRADFKREGDCYTMDKWWFGIFV
ncbi:hypothetical protein C0995_009968 [Termitomyces sp. Mi166|nr:hypothetical protein C0995_009968 [Termitomyces sp. Mi166\